MTWAQPPTDQELEVLIEKLHGWRQTLSETEQRLIDSLAAAALGQPSALVISDPAPLEQVGGCPRWCTTRWLATPWGMAHTARDW